MLSDRSKLRIEDSRGVQYPDADARASGTFVKCREVRVEPMPFTLGTFVKCGNVAVFCKWNIEMKHTFIALASTSFLLFTTTAFSQNAAVDPQCLVNNSDGTQKVDMTKCPDGKTVGAAQTTTPPAAGDTTAATTPASPSLTLDPNVFGAGRIISANDFIGKTVYTTANENIGEVNDIILSDDNKVRGVILGVGGFLGIGEKNVAVDMNKIQLVQDGNAMKLTVDATKDMLTAAPAYDTSKRTYIQ